jgi:hypothetical protein
MDDHLPPSACHLDDEWFSFVRKQQLMYDPIMFSALSSNEEESDRGLMGGGGGGDGESEGPSKTAAHPSLLLHCPPSQPPPCEELVISTKTKCLYLNAPIPIYDVFWNVPILPYWKQENGIIKKQTKIICESPEAYEDYRNRLKQFEAYEYSEKVIKFVDNTGYVPSMNEETQISKTAANRRRIKYKNERKLTFGISKKDILNVRRKEKQGAFYNCVALTLRIEYKDNFYEFHAKIFNTGKIEVPGRMNNAVMEIIKARIIEIMQPFIMEQNLHYKACKRGVLINSGFNCGFYIDRDKMYNIIREKYGIEVSYDSCSYQGIKCKFYFNHNIGFNPTRQTGRMQDEDVATMKETEMNKKYTVVPFMIFRTGSCIIVGNCSKKVLYFIYEFTRRLLHNEYGEISMGNREPTEVKKKKSRRIFISVTQNYYDECVAVANGADNPVTGVILRSSVGDCRLPSSPPPSLLSITS